MHRAESLLTVNEPKFRGDDLDHCASKKPANYHNLEWIHSFDAPCFESSWITNAVPDHYKGMHPIYKSWGRGEGGGKGARELLLQSFPADNRLQLIIVVLYMYI